MSPPHDGVEAITEEYFDKVSAVNLKGPFRLSARLGPLMAEAGGGSIINVSTIGSLRPAAAEIVYACAKAGLNALTIALAGELAPAVRVNALLPGAVDTDIARAWSPEMREGAMRGAPLGRLGTPDDFVGPALWLASGPQRLRHRHAHPRRRRPVPTDVVNDEQSPMHNVDRDGGSQRMWDFSTDPEFEAQLQWMREFTAAEVAPLDLVWPHHHHKAPAPWLKKVIDPLKDGCASVDSGPATSGPNSAARASARSSSA